MTQNLLQNMKIKDLIFNIFDTESTGNNSFRKDEPIELAYLLFNYENAVVSCGCTIMKLIITVINNLYFTNCIKIYYFRTHTNDYLLNPILFLPRI